MSLSRSIWQVCLPGHVEHPFGHDEAHVAAQVGGGQVRQHEEEEARPQAEPLAVALARQSLSLGTLPEKNISEENESDGNISLLGIGDSHV